MQIVSSLPSLSERFAAIMASLVRAVRDQAGESPLFRRVWPVVWNRIMAVSAAVVAVIGAIEGGIVRPVRVRAVGAALEGRVVRVRAKVPFSDKFLAWRGVPTRFGWVVGHGGWKVAAFLGQLEHLLRDPEMQRLLAASPRLGRAMRPVCRMLGVDPRVYEEGKICPVVAGTAKPVVAAAPVASDAPVEDVGLKFVPFWIRSSGG